MDTFGADARNFVAALSDACDDAIVIVGLDGTILGWSRGASASTNTRPAKC
jgi:hypothetical protein